MAWIAFMKELPPFAVSPFQQ